MLCLLPGSIRKGMSQPSYSKPQQMRLTYTKPLTLVVATAVPHMAGPLSQVEAASPR